MTVSRALLLSCLAILSVSQPVPLAAQQAQWFGLQLPRGLSTPHEATILLGDDDKAAPLPAVVPTGEEGWSHLEGRHIRPYLERVVRFSLQSRERGDALWGRIAGMPALRDTARWVAGEFSEARLTDVNVDDFGVAEPLWIPTQWMVTVQGSGNPDIVLESAFPQRPSSGTDGTLTAPLVFVGTGSSADLANVNVDGKVAVVHKKPDPGLYHSRIDTTEIAARGAVAMIHVIELPGNMHSFDAGGCAAAIPCFHVGGEDGFFLEAAIGAAAVAGHPPLEVSLSLGVEERPNATAANAVGTVPGNGRTSRRHRPNRARHQYRTRRPAQHVDLAITSTIGIPRPRRRYRGIPKVGRRVEPGAVPCRPLQSGGSAVRSERLPAGRNRGPGRPRGLQVTWCAARTIHLCVADVSHIGRRARYDLDAGAGAGGPVSCLRDREGRRRPA